MKTALIFGEYNEQQKQEFEKLDPDLKIIYGTDPEWPEHLDQVNAIVGFIPQQYRTKLKDLSNLELYQLPSAGYEGWSELVRCPLANARGTYGLTISEYLIGTILMVYRRYPEVLDNQKKHVWKDPGKIESIYGKTILVLGTGNLGSTFAKKAQALGAYTIGFNRHPGEIDGFNEVVNIKDFRNRIGEADILINTLPASPETEYFMTLDDYKAMKRSAMFVNVGRGSFVSLDTLEQALKEKLISSMILDVFEKEPLPADNPLWDEERVLITPHIAGGYDLPETRDLFMKIALANLKAMLSDKKYINIVN